MGTDKGKREPTLDELLGDPMMLLVFERSGLTMDDVRTMLRELAARLAKQRANEDESQRE